MLTTPGQLYANPAVKVHWGGHHHAPDWNTEADQGRKAKGDRQSVLFLFHMEVWWFWNANIRSPSSRPRLWKSHKRLQGKVSSQEMLLIIICKHSWTVVKTWLACKQRCNTICTFSVQKVQWRFRREELNLMNRDLESSQPPGLLVCDGECWGFRGRWGSRAGMPGLCVNAGFIPFVHWVSDGQTLQHRASPKTCFY